MHHHAHKPTRAWRGVEAAFAVHPQPISPCYRRVRRPSPRRERITQAGRGCMMLDGEGLVWFDRRYLLRPGDMALVINHEGQPMVAPVVDRPGSTFSLGRMWIERWPRPMRTWEHMVLIGAVTTPAGKPKRITAH